jgi:hypothetical protein
MKIKKTLMSLAAAFLAVFFMVGCEPVDEAFKPVKEILPEVVGDNRVLDDLKLILSPEEYQSLLAALAEASNPSDPSDPSDPGTPEAPVVDKTGLSTAILGAEIAKASSVYRGTDRESVPNEVKWVTQTVWDTFETAIAAAEQLRDDPSATQAQIDDATDVMLAAIMDFEDAIDLGTNITITVPNTDGLKGAITTAKAAKTGILIDTIAANVEVEKQWVTQEVMDAFNTAITNAEKLLSDPSASQPEITVATSAVTAATRVFTAAIAEGTKASTSPLTNAIIAAKTAGIQVSVAADAAAVEKGKFFVTQEVLNVLNTAITHAETLATDPEVSQAAVEAEAIALNAAVEAFENAKQEGTKVELVEDKGNYLEKIGSGTLISRGPATGTGTTYYLDAENGNDAYNGTSPLTPWKSFKNVNDPAKTFGPGDHILLEADSIWNGKSVDTTNKDTLLTSDEVGMLLIRENSNGTVGNPIVIDLYDIDNFSASKPTVSWSANKRPIINGNGTPSPGTDPYAQSGAITVLSPDQIEVRNIEVTNSFDNFLSDPNSYYRKEVRKALVGIWMNQLNTDSTKHIEIVNCYAHDVQSEHTNNGASPYTSTYFGSITGHASQKIVGGIIINPNGKIPNAGASTVTSGVMDDVLMEGNIVRRVALEGLRTGGSVAGKFTNLIIRGNYVSDIAGDGIVMASVDGGSVESNIVKNSCAAPTFGTANYAGNWAWYAKNTTFQYNETYGILYGYQDGEAWDIDSGCDKVVYQYNYSHHNPGGSILFMSGPTNSVFRYNISANDAGTSRYMATEVIDPATDTVSTSANSYTAWTAGQTIFHYGNTGETADNKKPLIYNNTLYIGDGITCGLYGENSTSGVKKYVRFYNNVIVKVGTGTVYMSYGHNGGGHPGTISNPAGFKNNILWAYETAAPASGVQGKFNNGTSDMSLLIGVNGNTFENPNLKIQTSAAEFRLQRGTVFPESDYANAEALKTFTGKAKLRSRAHLFSPASESSPVTSGGMAIPGTAAGTQSSLDGAWNADPLTEDFFGNTIDNAAPPRGVAVKSYTP